MKRFTDFLREAYKDHRRCTSSACNILSRHHGMGTIVKDGEDGPKDSASALQRMKNHGLKIYGHMDQSHVGKTVKKFVADHPTGTHYIVTHNHAMAVVDGKLHDGANRGPDNRKVVAHFEVRKT